MSPAGPEAAPPPVRVEFWSNVEYFGMVRAVADRLRSRGWQVELRHQVSARSYRTAASRLARLALRLRTYLVYPAQLALRLLFSRSPLIVVVSTNTFYAPWVARLFARRNTRVVHLLYDLFPDVLLCSGDLKAGTRMDRLMRHVTRQTLLRCHATVFIGSHMREFACRQYGTPPIERMIEVGADDRVFASEPLPAASEPVGVLYCGNLGHMHDTRTVLEALDRVADSPLAKSVRVVFHANGSGWAELCQAVASRPRPIPLELHGLLPDREWIECMRAHPVALVTLKEGAGMLVVPSKTYSALAAGQAVVAVCPPDCDLAQLVRKYDCGWVVSPGDADGLARVLGELAGQPDLLATRRANALSAARAHFASDVLASQWDDLLRTLDPTPQAHA